VFGVHSLLRVSVSGLHLFYAISPLITWRIDPQDAARETRAKPAGIP